MSAYFNFCFNQVVNFTYDYFTVHSNDDVDYYDVISLYGNDEETCDDNKPFDTEGLYEKDRDEKKRQLMHFILNNN